MDKNYDVTALGELLIDFIETGESSQGNQLFEANPGGAPCNVLSMLSRLGKKTAFIGKVGNDQLGQMLEKTLKQLGIDTRGLWKDAQVHTTLAFVHKLENGDRDFSFYRAPGADMMLCCHEVDADLIQNSKIFHFGTVSMTHETVREATKLALNIAKESGAMISFDPNLRKPLWDDLEEAKRQIWYGLSMCDILKISDNEIEWLTQETDYTKGVAKIREKHPIPLILVSMGQEGSRAYYKDMVVHSMPFLSEDTVETTGAGDTFCGNVLNYVLEHGLKELTKEGLEEMLLYANAAASIITTRKGALKVMPNKAEIESLAAEGTGK